MTDKRGTDSLAYVSLLYAEHVFSEHVGYARLDMHDNLGLRQDNQESIGLRAQ